MSGWGGSGGDGSMRSISEESFSALSPPSKQVLALKPKSKKPMRMSSFGPFREPHSSERFIRRLHSPDFAKDVPETCGFALAGFGLVTSYCVRNRFGDRATSALFDREIGDLTWPGVMHLTSFALNLRSYLFESSQVHKKFVIPSLYSSTVALLSAQVLQRGGKMNMIMKDAFGASFHYFRFIQWAFTTPAMLHQIVMLADARPMDEWLIHASNWGMLITGFLGHVVKQKSVAIGCLVASWGCFFSSMRAVHRAFKHAASAAKALVVYADRMDEERSLADEHDADSKAERTRLASFSQQTTGGFVTRGSDAASFEGGRPSSALGPASPGGASNRASMSPVGAGGFGRPSMGAGAGGRPKHADDEALSELGDEVGGLDAVRNSAQLTLKMIDRAHWLTVALWPTFGITDLIASRQLLPLRTVENVFSFLDVFSKVLFTSALSLTGQVTQDEHDKQMATVAGNKAVELGRKMRRRTQSERAELEEQSERLANLCQEGWNLVIKDLVNSAVIPEVVIGEGPSEVQPEGGGRESLEGEWADY